MLLSVLLSVVLLCFSSYSSAQQVTLPSTTGDLLEPDASKWSGTYGTGWWGGSTQPGSPNGTIPNRIPPNTGFIWGGANNIISTSIAINTALQQAGIQVNGFTYKWRVKNGNANWFAGQPGIDDFEITVDVLDSNGNVYQSYTYDYSNSHNWTNHTGAETFPNQFLPPSYFSDINIYAQGSDSANWAGLYGPEFNVRDSEFNLIFQNNPCHTNPLYDPQCQGYATALFNQQCTTNPLFDPTCSGYAAAYLTQQCAANPLYDPQCPGYANAYYNQQCSLNPLFDSGCTGYAQAYFNQQCSLNPLYNSQCTGYAAAYLKQQCSLDPLYDVTCTGYAQAYYNQQCSLDPLYDSLCTGYDAAYLLQQCNADALYDVQCIGYQLAYIEQQCELDPLYDVTCLGYQEAIALEELNEEIIDDGIEDTEIDIVTTTIIEGIPNVLSAPVLPPVQIVELEETVVEEEYDMTEGDALAMEDDIEKEIKELEKAEAEEEPVEEEVVVITEDGSDEELPGNADGTMGNGESTQEDDIEKEIAELEKQETKENKDAPKKKTTRNEKMKMLLAQKAIELTKKVEESVSIEQQMLVQRQLLALISYVPGFDYAEKKLNQVNFYPPKPVVDHAYARWFLNDPNFVAMEDLQYNFK